MGIKEFFEKRKLLQKERLKKKLLEEQEKKKKEDEIKKSYPKCKNCGNTYIQELSGPNEYPNVRGFCKETCITGYLLKSVKIIRQHTIMLDKGLVNLDGRIKYVDDKIKKIVIFLLKLKKEGKIK